MTRVSDRSAPVRSDRHRRAAAEVRPGGTRARRRPGWVPNQHGAWAMVAVPFLVGLVIRAQEAGLGWATAPLLATWLLGYFTFFASSLWLKSGRRPRYRPPVLAYGGLTAFAGLLVLAAEPGAVGWLVVYAPLLSVGLWFAAKRDERSVASGFATVLAASVMAVVVRFPDPGALIGGAGSPPDGAHSAVWVASAMLLGYFFGTVLYVKTLIRERGSRGWLAASTVYHGVLAAAAVAAASASSGSAGGFGVSWWLAGFAVAMAVRAALVPLAGPMRGVPVSPKTAGLVEAGVCVLLVALLTVPGLRS